METISKPMTADHRRCDDLFVETEQAVIKKNWSGAERLIRDFEQSMLCHFSLEEEQLFPAMEEASSQANGPIRVMTMEHDQMRHLIGNLKSAIAEKSQETSLGISETLLVTMQQHNMKEENILYPLADRLVPGLGEGISQGMAEL